MKKSSVFAKLILFCLSGLSSAGMVSAADISIGNYKYPSIILIPIISIAVSLIILLVLAFRITKRKDTMMIGNVFHQIHGIKSDIKKPKHARKAEKEEKKKEVGYITELKRFKTHLPNMESEKAFDILTGITKNFFKELLGLNYEFTYSELAKELQKRNKRKELIDICQKFSELKYGDSKVSREELAEFADELEILLKREKTKKEEEELGISQALHHHKKGFFNDLFQNFSTSREEASNEINKKKKMLELMDEEKDALRKDMDIAKNIYHRILTYYYKLPPNERKEVYGKLKEFYDEVNNMLFSSIYSEKSKKELEYFANKLAQMKEETERMEGKKDRHEHEKLSIERKEIIHRGVESKEESKLRFREIKKLQSLEEEARERIRTLGESIVKQSIEKEFTESKPKKEVSQISKPATQAKPAVYHEHIPEHKTQQQSPSHIEIESPKIEIPHFSTKITPSQIPQMPVAISQKRHENKAPEKPKETAKQKTEVKLSGRSKKMTWIDKEAEQLKARLEKLQHHNYIG